MKPNIELHIEELVLSGVDRRDAARVAQAVQAQLESLLRAHGLPPGLARGAEIRELRSGQAGRGAGAEQLGNSVARAVFSGFEQHMGGAGRPGGGDHHAGRPKSTT